MKGGCFFFFSLPSPSWFRLLGCCVLLWHPRISMPCSSLHFLFHLLLRTAPTQKNKETKRLLLPFIITTATQTTLYRIMAKGTMASAANTPYSSLSVVDPASPSLPPRYTSTCRWTTSEPFGGRFIFKLLGGTS